MIEMILDGGLLRFDGEVIELFDERRSSDRYHIRFLNKLEFSDGRKGIRLLSLDHGKGGGFSSWIIPAEEMEQAQKFMEAVQAAKANL
ncbi:MAG TPA: hypothetical protein VLA72_17350 [Anaerolineales bacterium]|nr:hypothetical protein [Anaerolineales bacterium]